MNIVDVMRRDLADAEREERAMLNGAAAPAVVPAEANEEEGWRTARDFFLGLFIGFGVAVAVYIIGGIIVNYSIN